MRKSHSYTEPFTRGLSLTAHALMSNRPSVTSPLPTAALANGHANLAPPPGNGDKSRSRSLSTTSNAPNTDMQTNKFDPDEVFRKHTISDVKFIQQRLRADADAKQEELRLMVGERYRDLLQASTSIISMAESSRHVTQTLEEIKATWNVPRLPTSTEKPATNHDDDVHLQVLQRLAAHVKLLLDAPELLWRLLERKKYLQATWLFLLARVIRRALARDNDDEEGSWTAEGIDVVVQFPLVRRQWEAVSQFRSQIANKATHFLRDHSAPKEDTCAAILALHLLESRPLSEALSLFLAQRTRSLQSSLSWASKPASNQLMSQKYNGHARRGSTAESSHADALRQSSGIKEATHSSLNIILRTLQTARELFRSSSETSQDCLVQRVLRYIQSDVASSSEANQTLPQELYPSTQAIIAILPSSTHLSLLPHDIKTYRPYVDLASPSSNIRSSQFTEKINDWFSQSVSSLRPSIERWFNDLTTVKEVWGIRSSTQTWIFASGLEDSETEEMMGVLDEICYSRAIAIWDGILNRSLQVFGVKLSATVTSLSDGAKRPSPSEDLFLPLPLPTSLQTIAPQGSNAFLEYKASLMGHLLGRTSLLDEILGCLEGCAQTIQQDFAHIKDTTSGLCNQLEGRYRPHADKLCESLADKVQSTATALLPDTVASTRSLVFLGQLTEELSSSSPFAQEIGCQPLVAQSFRATMLQHCDTIVDRWRTQVISHILADMPAEYTSDSPKPLDPSSSLVHALLSLSDALQEMSNPRHSPRRESLIATTLAKFVTSFMEEWDEDPDAQYAYDLAFLRQIVAVHANELNDIADLIETSLNASLPENMTEDEVLKSAALSLARMQNLFATLLPRHPDSSRLYGVEKTTLLLPLGVPVAEQQQYQSALAVAKPTSRFGLLMVDGVH